MHLRHGLIGIAALLACGQAAAATVEVMKSPYCGCCTDWVKHLEANGFDTRVVETEDVAAVAERLGVPGELRSCHSATVAGYAIEGHVPASDIKRLLRERPKATGLAVPGMPAGSPGMDRSGRKEPYRTILFWKGGKKVFASHNQAR